MRGCRLAWYAALLTKRKEKGNEKLAQIKENKKVFRNYNSIKLFL